MTPQEQIAYLRRNAHDWQSRDPHLPGTDASALLAVCDLAERALLTDDEAEAVRNTLAESVDMKTWQKVDAVLRRLLPDERVEHRLVHYYKEKRLPVDPFEDVIVCSCGARIAAYTLHDAIALGAAHAGIGGTE